MPSPRVNEPTQDQPVPPTPPAPDSPLTAAGSDHSDPELERLIIAAFASDQEPGPTLSGRRDVNLGRGVFSSVTQVSLQWADSKAHGVDLGREDRGSERASQGTAAPRPASVVVKRPAPGANGQAAVAMGACRREALAYRKLLAPSPVRSPQAYLVELDDDGAARFVLEDLSRLRLVDQLDGLEADDTLAVAAALAGLHRYWRDDARLEALAVRRATPAALAPEALERGLAALDQRWRDGLSTEQRAAFAAVVGRRAELVEAFVGAGPLTLCHGDPRADNLAFEPDGTPVFYDWQQLAVQFGSADLAWLAATSLTPANRRLIEGDLISAYGTTIDAYRLGFVLPGLAVLLLAQRSIDSERSARFVATSLDRIGTALVDLDLARL